MNGVGAARRSANRKSGLRAGARRYDVEGVSHLFQFRRYRLPLRAPVRTAHGAWTEREGVLVRLANAAGAVGFGEAAVIPWFGTETVDEAEAACRELGDRVEAEHLAAVPVELPGVRNALAAALADLARAPEAEADGARRKFLPVAALLPAGRGAPAAVRAKEELGFRIFKWKVGVGDVAEELPLLDEVCAALPSGAKLRLDANGAWTLDEARRRLDALAGMGVAYVEQPCAGAEVFALGERAVPWAADEALIDAGHRARFLADADARRGCAAVVLKPMALGWMAAREAAVAAGALGLGVVVTHLLDGPVALAAACELARSVPGVWACGLDRHPGLDAWPAVPVPQAQGPWARRATGGGLGLGEEANKY